MVDTLTTPSQFIHNGTFTKARFDCRNFQESCNMQLGSPSETLSFCPDWWVMCKWELWMYCLVFSTQNEGQPVVQWFVYIFWAFPYVPIVRGWGWWWEKTASSSLPLGSKRNLSKRKVQREGRKEGQILKVVGACELEMNLGVGNLRHICPIVRQKGC